MHVYIYIYIYIHIEWVITLDINGPICTPLVIGIITTFSNWDEPMRHQATEKTSWNISASWLYGSNPLVNHRKNHRKMGKPEDNQRKMEVYPLVMTVT